jgi:rubredoxin
MQKRIYECQYCSLDFPALDLVVEHIARAHPVGTNCKICNEKFCDEAALKQHTRDKHWRMLPKSETTAAKESPPSESGSSSSDEGPPTPILAFTQLPEGWRCNECRVTFPKQESYHRHICNPASVNRCKRCKLSFGTHLALVRHISMVHGTTNGKSKFNCKVCGAGFAHEVSFQRHVSAHLCV